MKGSFVFSDGGKAFFVGLVFSQEYSRSIVGIVQV